MCDRITALKFVGFAVGLAAKFVTGSIFVFNSYQDAIKYNFNYTQTEVELLSSMLNVGLGVGFIPGMFYDRFGPAMTSGAGLIVSVPVYLLMWSTVKYAEFYSKRVWLMAIYFLLAGFGSVFTYMVALNTNVINFSAKHTGKVVGFLNAFFAGSPSVFGTLFYRVFTHGDSTDPANQDFAARTFMYNVYLFNCSLLVVSFNDKVVRRLSSVYLKVAIVRGQNFSSEQIVYVLLYIFDKYAYLKTTILFFSSTGFMLFFAILFGIVNILCMFFLRIYVIKDIRDDVTIKYIKNSNGDVIDDITSVVNGQPSNGILVTEETTLKAENAEEGVPMTLMSTLRRLDFQIFSWMFAFASSVGLVYGNNITVTSKSVGLDYYNDRLVIIIPITNAIVSAFIGVISDMFKDRIPRQAIVTLACLTLIVAQALVITLADTLSVFVTATVLAGFGIGIIWSLCPTIMKEMFSVEHLGRNWGIALLIAALLAFASQEVFGTLYDIKIPEGDGNYCYGMACIRGGYGVFLGVAVLALLMGLTLLLMRRLELFASMLNIGLGIGFLPGMFYDRFGPRLTSFVGLLVSVSAYLLLWSTTKAVRFYSKNSWLMAIYFLICDFGGFMLMFAISFAVVDILCIICMNCYRDDDPEFVQFNNEQIVNDVSHGDRSESDSSNEMFCFKKRSSSTNSASTPSNPTVYPYADREMSLKEILLNADYQLILWMISFASVIGLVYANNITLISKSVHLNQHDGVLTIVIPITNAIISFSVGIVSDIFKHKIPRVWILILSFISFTLSQVLVILFANSYGILIVSLVLVGNGVAILWTIAPTIIKEMFYIGNLGRNWGACLLVMSLIGAGLQEAFGAMYDHMSSGEGDDLHCYGMKCITGGTALIVACGATSLVLSLVFIVKQRVRSRSLN
ncbi:hypothetical protein MAR_021880 [Mya arenaria]|uniref:Nodulin-like domain-containing protein n=1 Tax=Mya arenaria TaxID=6604 RepID=A0ABY7ECS7_MYAAR|nr:hypothetical protein MAR_021880 [Mya arenaria]